MEKNETGLPTPIDANHPEVKVLIAAAVKDALADFKVKIEAAYKQRDAAQARVAELEAKDQQREIEALKAAGKDREAFELELAALKAQNAELAVRNTTLARDNLIKSELGAFTFRNKKAAELALSEITAQMIKGEDGNWVHKSGQAIEVAVKTFAEDKDNSFLFKAKTNSGSGEDVPSGTLDTSPKGKSLFEMSQADVMKMAEQGKLRQR
jgi:hypothetical protein